MPPRSTLRMPTVPRRAGYAPPTIQATYPTFQDISPEVSQYLQEAGRLTRGIESSAETAYGTYEDLIRQMAGGYGARASQAGGTARQAAFSTGFTPLEATQAGQEATNEAFRQYYQMLPQIRAQQAMIPMQAYGQAAPMMGNLAELYRMASQTPGPTYQTTWAPEQLGQPGVGTAGLPPEAPPESPAMAYMRQMAMMRGIGQDPDLIRGLAGMTGRSLQTTPMPSQRYQQAPRASSLGQVTPSLTTGQATGGQPTGRGFTSEQIAKLLGI